MMRVIGILVPFLVLASCGTPEFRAEQNVCQSTWLTKIPPRLERELYNRRESRQVPTGRTTCQTVGTVTNCVQGMRTEFYTVPSVRTVDRNRPRRDAQVRQCTQKTCFEKFGNVECKA